MDDIKLMDFPDEIIYNILTYVSSKDLLRCRGVCKRTNQLINNEKRLMDRLILNVIGKSYQELTVSEPNVHPKFTNLKVVRVKYNGHLTDYLLTLLPSINRLTMNDCEVEQHEMLDFFNTIFSVCNHLEAIKLHGFRIRSSGGSTSRKRLKVDKEEVKRPTVKLFHITVYNVKHTIELFERFQDINANVQSLSIEFDNLNDMCNKFHYELMEHLGNLLEQHCQHIIKELTLNIEAGQLDVGWFYGRLMQMEHLQLHTLRLYENDYAWQRGKFVEFIERQTALCVLEILNELETKTIDVLASVWSNLTALTICLSKDLNCSYFWREIPTMERLKVLKIYVELNSTLDNTIDFAKLPELEVLEVKKKSQFIFSPPRKGTVSFLSLQHRAATMKSLVISELLVVGYDAIFQYMDNLVELALDHVGDANLSAAINNLKRLEKLHLDDAVARDIPFMESLKLPKLTRLSFFKSRDLVYVTYSSYIDGLESRYLKIPFKTLKVMKRHCPRLMCISDDEFGVVYRISATSGRFYRCCGYQTDSNSGSDAEHCDDNESEDSLCQQFG